MGNLEKDERMKQLIVLGRDKLNELEKEYVATEKQLEMLEETLKAAMNRPRGELKLAIEDAEKEVEETKLKRESEQSKGIGEKLKRERQLEVLIGKGREKLKELEKEHEQKEKQKE